MSVKTYGIHDKWTDINKNNNVDIKSVDGVIESVKINGEEAGGGGGGDFTTAGVTFSSTAFQTGFSGIAIFEEDGTQFMEYDTLIFGDTIGTKTYNLVLFKGLQTIEMPEGVTATVTGNATVVEGRGIKITGDCTITI